MGRLLLVVIEKVSPVKLSCVIFIAAELSLDNETVLLAVSPTATTPKASVLVEMLSDPEVPEFH
jgi:hypothetical protein